MSTIKISSVDSECSSSSLPLFSITEKRRNSIETTSNIDKNTGHKQVTFQVKNSSFQRKIEIKTKQEETICSTKKISPLITFSTTTTNPMSSPKLSSKSNSSIPNVRVSIISTPNQNETIIEKPLEQIPIISNEEKQNFDHRPLRDLINKKNSIQPEQNTHSSPPPSRSPILPAKQFSAFRPTILHKKPQKTIGQFNLINNEETFSSFEDENRIMRSRAFSNPIDNKSNCFDDSSLLSSISGTSTSTSHTNVTPTLTTNIDDKNEAKRKAIVMQMYDTEKSYVEALKNLVTKYYLPMKDKDIVSNDLINDIFYKIPEIHIHHTAFLISLSQKLTQWDNKQTVGDVLLQMFTRTSVIETYTSFVNNYKTAQIAIHLCKDFSSFNKFLEQQARDHRGKLTLRDLIIQPVQRIPRYELFIKDFLRCTNLTHPDYPLLIKAQSEIHSLAEQIDHVQREVGSTDLNVNKNSLEVVQDMIENLDDLVNPNRYYIRHDFVTTQLSSGIKKDRCMFLFNDLILITSSKGRTGKPNNSVMVNSPSGKQYIDNAKHKLIMKISLESVDLATDHLKKRRSSMSAPQSLKQSHVMINNILDRHRHLEEDIIILRQINDLAKTITTPHQDLDDSIKEIVSIVNKYLIDETKILTNIRRTSPEPNLISDQKHNNIQLIINRTDHIETIDVLFSSLENKINWEKKFLEAKKNLFENGLERKNIKFEHVLTLPHHRPGSQFTCGTIRLYSNDLCLCSTEGEICLIDLQSDIQIKSFNQITSSKINCIQYISSNKDSKNFNFIKHQQKNSIKNKEEKTTVDSLLDYDSSDDEQQENISLDEHFTNSMENQQEDTIWIGTDNGGLLIYECSQTMKMFGRRNRIIKQLNCSIHSILYNDNKVFVALNHRQLCVFKRDINDRWDLDNSIIKIIEENNEKSSDKTNQIDNEENVDRISVMSFVEGKLWCGIRDRIFVVCPNSLDVQHSFIVDDYHRHVCSITTGGSSINHVWIASQDSHEIRLFHSQNFACLLEFSIRTFVTQKLQVCDDIIRAHKLGCLHVNTLHIYNETLWIGTSAGIILNLTISQLIDSLSTNKLTQNSIQLECLSFGHEGPGRFFISNNQQQINQFIISIGDGFEDFNNNEENLGKDDALSHLIFCKL